MKIKMAVTSKEAKLESQLTCAICLDRYDDPRMLPCAHSYCKDCIDCLPVELEKGRHAVKCPTCRKPTLLEEGASALPIAFYINNMMEIHSDGLQKTDAKTDLPPTKGEDSRQLCHAHENKPMDLYCETCRFVSSAALSLTVTTSVIVLKICMQSTSSRLKLVSNQ